MNLNIISYNCNSIRKKIDIIRELLNNCDILFLQEILLTIDNVDFVEGIHNDFNNVIVPSQVKENTLGRPQSGLVILYRKFLSKIITPVYFSKHFVAVTLTLSPLTSPDYLLINAYLPCDTRSYDALVDYKNALGELHNLIETENVNKVIIAGDLNADPFKGRFYEDLDQFILDKKFIMADRCLPLNSYTYISPHNTTSWIDHVLISQPGLVQEIKILYEATINDHVPLKFNLRIDSLDSSILENNNLKTDINLIKWDSLTKNEKIAYAERLETDLKNYFNLGMQCRDHYCNSNVHISLLNHAYSHLINSIKKASKPFNNALKNNFKPVPGWNQHCKELYAIARKKYKIWNNGGRIRLGYNYEQMKISRSDFKLALKQCKRERESLKKIKLQQSFQYKDKKSFWRDVKNLKNNKTEIPTVIDKINDPVQIAELFSSKYKHILNDPNCIRKTEAYNKKIHDIREECRNKVDFISISPKQAASAIKSLNTSLSFDSIHSNHLKLANNYLSDFLSRLFTAFLCHGHVPKDMTAGEIRPTVKNKQGKLNSSENY